MRTSGYLCTLFLAGSILGAMPVAGRALASGVVVAFEDASPWDFIVVENDTGCDLVDFELEIDLTPSAGRLFFDIAPGGPGYSESRPFRLAEGRDSVIASTDVLDGDRSVRIRFLKLLRGDRVVFTVDIDDSMEEGPLGPTIVLGPEIAGAAVSLRMGAFSPVTVQFDSSARAILPDVYCQIAWRGPSETGRRETRPLSGSTSGHISQR